MFVKDFFFSFSLLAFTAILMILGSLLLLDALRRFATDAYKSVRTRANIHAAAPPALAAAKQAEEKSPILEEAA
jgi:hypothetical protein